MVKSNLTSAPGNPVLAVQINMDKNFAFIEVGLNLLPLSLPFVLHSSSLSGMPSPILDVP